MAVEVENLLQEKVQVQVRELEKSLVVLLILVLQCRKLAHWPPPFSQYFSEFLHVVPIQLPSVTAGWAMLRNALVLPG